MQMLMGSDVMVAMSDSMSDTMSVTYSEIRASTGEETWKLYSQEEQFIRVMMATDMVNIKTSLHIYLYHLISYGLLAFWPRNP